MRFFVLLLAILPVSAFATRAVDDPNDRNLFSVYKPVNQENVLAVQAYTNGCSVKDLDFLWEMGVDANGRPQTVKRSLLDGSIRDRFHISNTRPTNAASCEKAVPAGTACNSISVSAAEMGWVNHGLKDPSLVVRADRADGNCKVAAYLDVGKRVIEIKALKVIADEINIKKFFGKMTGADFRVRSLLITPAQGAPLSFSCTNDCMKSEP